MKKYLLPESGNFYKANLHCHSTVSDGKLTPEELKAAYKAQGYSIIAYTDHDVLIPHPELADEDFLPLNGFEVEVNEETASGLSGKKTCHLCMIALDPDNLIQPCWHRTKYQFGNAVKSRDLVKFDENEPDYERVYTPECISDIMRRGREAGFFVTYNHPAWSLEEYPQYMNYHNMHAMEISNTGCIVEGFEDYCPHIYDDMLRGGKKIFCVSTDDNHNGAAPDSGNWDSFGGWVMIKAEKLDYRTITKALENGDFYASQGPVIHNVWFEDGEIHVECDPAASIKFSYGNRRGKGVYADGKTLTHASAPVTMDNVYVRITVTDEKGRPANTSAYWAEDLLKDE
ncbi:MAG: PHP domain-containing protein [Clostridia bacterium]|nr:PHP domain-containing protein [Clostridia bacterium]